MNSSHVFDWIEYTLATIQLMVLFGIIGVMALLVYKDYKKFDDKNYIVHLYSLYQASGRWAMVVEP